MMQNQTGINLTPSSSFPPRAYIIGAQKAGTTFLASLLDQHGGICVSRPKEPHFFTTNFDKGFDWYRSLFPNDSATTLIDASTTYSFLISREEMNSANAPGLRAPVPERIHAVRPDAKFIYVLRDPIDRMISAFMHLHRETVTPPEVSLDLMRTSNPMLYLASRYAAQIERYYEYFRRDAFLFVHFNDLTADPVKVARSCPTFLEETNQDFEFSLNKAETHSSHQLTSFGRTAASLFRRSPRLGSWAKGNTPLGLKKLMRLGIERAPKPVTFRDRNKLYQQMTDEREKITRLTGISFDS